MAFRRLIDKLALVGAIGIDRITGSVKHPLSSCGGFNSGSAISVNGSLLFVGHTIARLGREHMAFGILVNQLTVVKSIRCQGISRPIQGALNTRRHVNRG